MDEVDGVHCTRKIDEGGILDQNDSVQVLHVRTKCSQASISFPRSAQNFILARRMRLCLVKMMHVRVNTVSTIHIV